MRECRNCRWYSPGDTWPRFRQRGDCIRITPAIAGERPAEIHPHGTVSRLNVAAGFGCLLHEPVMPVKPEGE